MSGRIHCSAGPHAARVPRVGQPCHRFVGIFAHTPPIRTYEKDSLCEIGRGQKEGGVEIWYFQTKIGEG